MSKQNENEPSAVFFATRADWIALFGEVPANRWGPWEHNPDTNELRLDGGRYEVDLDECGSSAEVLDWICQVAKKTWANDSIVANLVRAINGTVDPQRNLCSFGVERGKSQQ